MPSLANLPPELFELVLGYAEEPHAREYLGGICRALHPAARRFFFRRVRLASRDVGCSVVKFCRLLDTSPGLSALVRLLEVDLEYAKERKFLQLAVETLLRRLPSLTDLCIASSIANVVLRHPPKKSLLPELQRLTIEGSFRNRMHPFEPSDYADLGALPHLEALHIAYWTSYDLIRSSPSILTLPWASQITSLSVGAIDHEGCSPCELLRSFNSLQRLELAEAKMIGGDLAAALRALPAPLALEHLVLVIRREVPPALGTALCRFTNLLSLSFPNPGVSHFPLTSIAMLPHLRTLAFGKPLYDNALPPFTTFEALLASASSCPSLQHLDIYRVEPHVPIFPPGTVVDLCSGADDALEAGAFAREELARKDFLVALAERRGVVLGGDFGAWARRRREEKREEDREK
ncbi:hypothetical protein JCM10213_001576 [Rhodosporidiobolus nylandii]